MLPKTQLGDLNARTIGMKNAINNIFGQKATNETIFEAYELVSRNWLEFKHYSKQKFNDNWSDEQDSHYKIDDKLKLAKKYLVLYEPADSVKGLITFLMNRVQ